MPPCQPMRFASAETEATNERKSDDLTDARPRVFRLKNAPRDQCKQRRKDIRDDADCREKRLGDIRTDDADPVLNLLR